MEITYYMKSKIECPTRVERLKSLRGLKYGVSDGRTWQECGEKDLLLIIFLSIPHSLAPYTLLTGPFSIKRARNKFDFLF